MAHVFHLLFYHFVWSTKDRMPILENNYGAQMVEMIKAACDKREVVPLACNAMPDHVHLFVKLPPNVAPSAFVGEIKGTTSFAWNRKFDQQRVLKWQDGYGVVSVREAEQEKVIRYVENQQQVHANRKASRLLETMESQ